MVNEENARETARAIHAAIEGDATEFSKKISYLVGNATLNTLNVKSDYIDRSISGAGALQACHSLGGTAWKTVEDFSRGDKLCTGLCAVSTVCEGVAITASTCKFIPGRYKIYLCAKGTSLALMRFRNFCRNAQGVVTPC